MSAAETTETPPQDGASPAPSTKKSRKKKKHVSKHVLKAKAEMQAVAERRAAETTAPSKTSKQKKNKKEVIKDPEEASAYLKSWQAKDGWKFNKNTQSWLLRHMYQPEKVSKSTFTILLDYMKGLQGKDVKRRVLEEATVRAKRYRDYEKAKEKIANAPEGEDKQEDESNSAQVESTADESKNDSQDDIYGLQHWQALDDRDKRKEYKRARRILEVLLDAS